MALFDPCKWQYQLRKKALFAIIRFSILDLTYFLPVYKLLRTWKVCDDLAKLYEFCICFSLKLNAKNLDASESMVRENYVINNGKPNIGQWVHSNLNNWNVFFLTYRCNVILNICEACVTLWSGTQYSHLFPSKQTDFYVMIYYYSYF